MTDDGKDLDERYLGINAKAKSAETADKASEATIVRGIGKKLSLIRPSALVNFTIWYNKDTAGTWTAPSAGIVAMVSGTGGAVVPSVAGGSGAALFVQEGDVVTTKWRGDSDKKTYVFTPMGILYEEPE